MINVLFIGDVNGKPGRSAVKAILPGLIKEHSIDFVIANGENSAGGFGIIKEKFDELSAAGVNVVTTGNHIWDKKEILPVLESEPRLLRPANFAPKTPGRGFGVYDLEKPGKKIRIGVVNVVGRIFMPPADCPFRAADAIVNEISVTTPIIIVDIHAEATSEKQALGFFLDGRVSAVLGTHTHVQTADERVFPKGTAFISDAGMCGPFDSVIGVDKEQIINRFLTHMPVKFELAKGDVHFNAALIEIDENTGMASKIERIDIKHG